jgi:antitoxin component YwqK of YwqJK toxin-antitoxin module
MRSNYFIPLLSLVAAAFLSSAQSLNYSAKDYSCLFQLKDGMLNGGYSSYYSNGQKKSEGNYLNNNRSGAWKFWDSTGKLVVSRVYENNFIFSQTLPTKIERSNLQKDSLQLIKYPPLKESDIYTSSRIWQNIKVKDNLPLQDLLKGSLKKIVSANAYFFGNEMFLEPIKKEVVEQNYRSHKELMSYKIKSDWFIDKKRSLAEFRVIGICPIICNKKDTIVLGWLYFPAIRKTLSEVSYKNKTTNEQINLDEIIFFRRFYGELEKQDNAKNISISSLKTEKERELERQRIQIELVECEHDFLLRLKN